MPNETEKIIEEYISKSPKTIKEFIVSGNWKLSTPEIAKIFNLDEQKKIGLENEIIFVLIGMEPKSDFAENIKTELGIDANEAEWIAEEVEKNIFSQVSAEIDSMWQIAGKETPTSQSKVGSDFEQIILNQARAMQPAQPADSGIMNHESRIMEEKKDETSRIIHDYVGSNDPYREPIN